MSHTGSSTVAWQQSRVSSHGSKRARVAKQRHLMSRFDLMHAGKFVTGFIPCVFPHTYLVHLSTVDDSKISYPSWVNIQSAGWVNIQSALTGQGNVPQDPNFNGGVNPSHPNRNGGVVEGAFIHSARGGNPNAAGYTAGSNGCTVGKYALDFFSDLHASPTGDSGRAIIFR